MLYFYISFAVYLAVLGITAAAVTRRDKNAARKNAWRVKESTLLLISFLGGAVVMLLTMRAIRHKTKHKRFMVGIPFIIVFHLVLIAGIIVLCWQLTGSFEFLIP